MAAKHLSLCLFALVACSSADASNPPSTPQPVADAGGGSSPSLPATPDAGSPPVTNDAAPPVDANTDAPSASYPAPHPDLPQVVNTGGPVLKQPKIVSVTYSNDTQQADIDRFTQAFLTSTSYWETVTAEYGVGPLAGATSIHLPNAAPARLEKADLRALVLAQAASHPEITSETIVTVFLPAGSIYAEDSESVSCTGFDALHGEVKAQNGTEYIYAVVVACDEGIPPVDVVTIAASHEWVEAATDPYVEVKPAFEDVDPDSVAWSLAGGGEVTDLCAARDDAYVRLPNLPFAFSRSWSNAAAKKGTEPCLPLTDQPYFNAAPVLNEAIVLTDGTDTVHTKGIKIAVGEQKTIEVKLFSTGPMTDWTVDAVEDADDDSAPPTLSFTWDRHTGNNGDTLHLTIKSLAKGPYAGSAFEIDSKAGNRQMFWPGFVQN